MALVPRIFLLAMLMAGLALAFQPRPRVVVGTVEAPEADRVPIDRVDHARWDRLLRRYVDDRGQVNYAGWHANAADRQELLAYLEQLSAAVFTNDVDENMQLAFGVNAYNALTVYGILHQYPTSSIRNHTPALFGYNLWRDLYLLIEGVPCNLEWIEHQYLRLFHDPRIHFAIVCASVGCPKLRREAYTAERLEAQLEDNARAFFADPTKLRWDKRRRTIWVSPILDWFAADFGTDEAQRLSTIRRWLPPAAQRLAAADQVSLRYLDYDWRLNERPNHYDESSH